jgi:hypothetical protein
VRELLQSKVDMVLQNTDDRAAYKGEHAKGGSLIYLTYFGGGGVGACRSLSCLKLLSSQAGQNSETLTEAEVWHVSGTPTGANPSAYQRELIYGRIASRFRVERLTGLSARTIKMAARACLPRWLLAGGRNPYGYLLCGTSKPQIFKLNRSVSAKLGKRTMFVLLPSRIIKIFVELNNRPRHDLVA